MPTNRQWHLVRRPVGLVRPSDFDLREEPVRLPGPRQVLVRSDYLSIDPANRACMWSEETYLPAQPLDTVVRGLGIGVVEHSSHPLYPVGSRVSGVLGWQDYALMSGDDPLLIRLPDEPAIPATMYLGLLGHIGMTAYFGLLEIGRPKQGDTLVVSAAAGAVGSLVGQIGKIHGCRVIGITDSADKCHWTRDELGFDAAINYKMGNSFKKLKELCSAGIDIYFDNVGGPLLEDVLNLINLRSRIVACGMLCVYNDIGGMLSLPAGPNNLLNLVLKRARIEGLVCLDYAHRATEAIDALSRWHLEGRMKYRVEVIEGLQNTPRALNMLFDGSNTGKLLVKVH